MNNVTLVQLVYYPSMGYMAAGPHRSLQPWSIGAVLPFAATTGDWPRNSRVASHAHLPVCLLSTIMIYPVAAHRNTVTPKSPQGSIGHGRGHLWHHEIPLIMQPESPFWRSGMS